MKIILSLFSGTALRVLTVAALAVAVLLPLEALAVTCNKLAIRSVGDIQKTQGNCPCPVICANFDGEEEHWSQYYEWYCVPDWETCPWPCSTSSPKFNFTVTCCDPEYCGPDACCIVVLPGTPTTCQICPLMAMQSNSAGFHAWNIKKESDNV